MPTKKQSPLRRFLSKVSITRAWQIVLAVVIAGIVAGTGLYAATSSKAATPASAHTGSSR